MNQPEKSPQRAEQQEAPAPERPTPEEEVRRQAGGPADKPSQAEGERDEAPRR